jgi:hypothetical protein
MANVSFLLFHALPIPLDHSVPGTSALAFITSITYKSQFLVVVIVRRREEISWKTLLKDYDIAKRLRRQKVDVAGHSVSFG